MQDRIQTPSMQILTFQPSKTIQNSNIYPKTPTLPLVTYKLAQQLMQDSGFDSTRYLQRAPKEQQEKPKSQTTEFYQKICAVADILTEHCSFDFELAEELLSQTDEMSDAFYIKMHVVMESLEQLNDHNDVNVEYPLYDNIKKYGLECSLEDQLSNTFSPVQSYLAPFDVRIHCPLMTAQISHIEYCFQDQKDKLVARVFPEYDRVRDPTLQQKAYCTALVTTVGEALPTDFIKRQPSAHELWVRLIAKRCGFQQSSISECYNYILDNNNHELIQQLSQLKEVETEVLNEKLNSLNNNGKQQMKQQVKFQYNEFIEQIIDKCVQNMIQIINVEPLQQQTARSYLFNSDFDISLRGMMEAKSTTHHFYQFQPNVKLAFIKPIIAAKLLQYRKAGDYARFVNAEISSVVESSQDTSFLFDDIDDQQMEQQKYKSVFINQIIELQQEFCGLILKQHQEILKVLINSTQANTYVETQFQYDQEYNSNRIFKDLVVRPVCGCYTCNLCSFSENYDYHSKIYPTVKLQKIQLESNLNNNIVYQINPKEFIEKTMSQQLSQEFNKMVPYFPKIVKKACEELNINIQLVQNIKHDEKIKSKETKQNHQKQKQAKSKSNVEQLLQQILLFSLSAPSFIQYPACYGPASSEYPAIVLSNTFRPGKPFDQRIEIFLTFLKNPANQNFVITKENEFDEQTNSPQNQYRTVPLSENVNVKRYLCQEYKQQFIEPGYKNLWEYSNYEVANLLYTRSELEDFDYDDMYQSEQNLLQDIRSINGLQIQLKNLPSLPIVKKYHGSCQNVQAIRMKQPYAIYKSKIVNKKLTLSDQSFIDKLYQFFEAGEKQSEKLSQQERGEEPGEEQKSVSDYESNNKPVYKKSYNKQPKTPIKKKLPKNKQPKLSEKGKRNKKQNEDKKKRIMEQRLKNLRQNKKSKIESYK